MENKFIKDFNLYEQVFTYKNYTILNSEKLPALIKEGNHKVVIESDEENGDSRSYDVNTSIIKDPKSLYGVLVTYKDTTELEKLKQKLAEKESLLVMSEMAASIVAHELKNPIFSIRGFLQLLEKSLGNKDKRCEYIKVILSELDRLHRLINNFLSSNNESIEVDSKVDLNNVIQDVIKLFKPRFKLKHIKCHFKKSDEDLIIVGNCDQLRQIIINILQNCYEAIDMEKNIYITTKSKKDYAVITVRDEGRGIDKEDLSHIFKPFYTTKKSGTGLGLFITKKIIEKHNGNIKVDSEKRRGTTFTLTFKRD